MGWSVTWGSDARELSSSSGQNNARATGGERLVLAVAIGMRLSVAGVPLAAASRSAGADAADARGRAASAADVARRRRSLAARTRRPARAGRGARARRVDRGARGARGGRRPRRGASRGRRAICSSASGASRGASRTRARRSTCTARPRAIAARRARARRRSTAARLAGDVAHDAATTYAELYRAAAPLRRRAWRATPAPPAAVPPRASRTSSALLVAFRPPQRVLEAIDEGLAGEGAIAQALAAARDAGPDDAGEAAADRAHRGVAGTGRDAHRRRPRSPGRLSRRRRGARRRRRRARSSTSTASTSGPSPRDSPLTGVVTRVRAEATSTGSRVSLDLDGRAWRRVFYMHEPYRIVVDVARNPPGVKGRNARAVARVVLDPGHGGKDTGAVGPAGVKEKDVTLDVAHRVAPVLAGAGHPGGAHARRRPLRVARGAHRARERLQRGPLRVDPLQRQREPRAARGIETYVLDTTRDEMAGRVAARENATTQAASAELASILGGHADGGRGGALDALRAAAPARVDDGDADAFGDAVDGGVHTAGFYVLVGARMPSVLFETSYISNATEEQRLASDDYGSSLADAIANAVKAYREA